MNDSTRKDGDIKNLSIEIRLESSICKMSAAKSSPPPFCKTHRRQLSIHKWNFEMAEEAPPPSTSVKTNSFRKKRKITPTETTKITPPITQPVKRGSFATLFSCFKREDPVPPYHPRPRNS